MLPLLLLHRQSNALQREAGEEVHWEDCAQVHHKTNQRTHGLANTYKPRFELLNQLKSNSPKDLKVVNFEVRDGELETYNPVNPAALQTINKTINKTDMDLTRLKNLAALVNKGVNLVSLSQVDLEVMDEMGLLDKK